MFAQTQANERKQAALEQVQVWRTLAKGKLYFTT